MTCSITRLSAATLQDVVTCIREHRTLEEAGRLLEANAERHLKSAEEMTRLVSPMRPKAIRQTHALSQALPFLAR